MNPSVRPQVQFAEPEDASFDAQLEAEGVVSGLPPVMARSSGGDFSYEALGLVVMGVGLFALALTIVIARSIKSK